MYKNKLIKYQNKIGGKIDPDFILFKSCIGKPRNINNSPNIKIRSREELIQYLKDKKSITVMEGLMLIEQLKIIDTYINEGERKIMLSDSRLKTFDELIL